MSEIHTARSRLGLTDEDGGLKVNLGGAEVSIIVALCPA